MKYKKELLIISVLTILLGFLVIVASALMYSQDRQGTTIASFVAGTIIDAVAALFFVQSKNAQKALAEFFDKLRKDRQQAESRALCESVGNPDARDALRIQLALYYACVEQSHTVAAELIAGAFGRPSPKTG